MSATGARVLTSESRGESSSRKPRTGAELEAGFLELLAKARSNMTEHGDGQQIYLRFVKPAMVDLHKVAAHLSVARRLARQPKL